MSMDNIVERIETYTQLRKALKALNKIKEEATEDDQFKVSIKDNELNASISNDSGMSLVDAEIELIEDEMQDIESMFTNVMGEWDYE